MPTPRRAVCPGSFDPVTIGHVDVIERATALFDEIVVVILHNPAKAGVFTVAERTAYLEQVLQHLPTVRVQAHANRLVVDVCRDLEAVAIVKGVRGGTDVAYEWPMALMNRRLTGVETILLPGNPAYEDVSSSLVKEVVRYGGDVTGLVSDPIRDALVERLRPA